jgi:hypothetical protein
MPGIPTGDAPCPPKRDGRHKAGHDDAASMTAPHKMAISRKTKRR